MINLLKSIFVKKKIEERSVTNLSQFRLPVLSAAGEVVTPDSAMTLSAVNACVRVIAEDIASLPFFVYERTEKGRKKAAKHPVYRLLHDEPNEDMGAMSFREALTANLLLHGNGFAFIDKKGARPVGLYPLLNANVKTGRINGAVAYQVKVNEKWVDVPTDQILHIKGLSFDGLIGKSVIEQAANSLGIALAVDKFGSKFFNNGATLSGFLSTPEKLTPATRDELKSSWATMFSGADNAFQTPVLGSDLKYTPLAIAPEQSQFLQTKNFCVVDVCRLFRISPTKIGDLTKSSYSTLEAASIDHVRSTLRPWLIRWEQECNRKLLAEVEKPSFYCEMEIDALTRGDLQSQDGSFATGIDKGWYSINEVRRFKNMEEIEGGDSYMLVPNGATSDNKTPPPAEEIAPEATQEPQEAQEAPAAATDPQPALEDSARFAPLIEDAATRIATKLGKALEREAKTATGKDLVSWFDAYLAEKSTVFAATIGPVARALKPASADIAIDNFGENLRSLLVVNLADAVEFDSLPAFTDQLNTYIQQAFKES